MVQLKNVTHEAWHGNLKLGDPCLMHPGALQDVERCPIAEELLQGLISRG